MNKEKLQGYLEKIKTTLGKVSKKMWILIGVIAAAVLALIIILAVVSSKNKPYSPLIYQATSEDMSTVLSWLQEQGVTDYRIEGTDTILVPDGQAPALKAKLLQEQYTGSKKPYSFYFEKVSAMSTQSERAVAEKAALIEDIQRTIRQFPGVRDVSVLINLGEDRGYVLDANNVVEATASVTLFMQDGKLLSNEQANAIRNYIAGGVAGLDVGSVTIEDSLGNHYNSFGTDGGSGSAAESSALKLQLEQEWENRIRTRIMQVLLPAYGEGNVGVAVNPVVELGDKTVVDYDVRLPEFAQDGSTNGGGILGSQFYAYEFLTDDDYAVGGIVGTTTNADIPTQVEQGEAENEVQRIKEGQGNKVYDNSKTQTEMLVHCGTLTDVSVAITINSRVVEDGIIDVNGVRQLAASAAGIFPVVTEEMTADEYMSWKIAVMATPFPLEPAEEEPPAATDGFIAGIPVWVFIAAGVGLLVFIIVLVIIIVIKRKKKKAEDEEQQAVDALLAQAMPPEPEEEVQYDEEGNPVTGANVMDMHTERSMELRQGIRDFVDENMEVAALLLKSWLKEDGDNG